MVIGGQSSHIIVVCHYQQRKDADGCVFDGMQGAHKIIGAGLAVMLNRFRNLEPHALGFKNLRRQIQRHSLEQPVGAAAPHFKPCYLICYFNHTVVSFCS